MGSEKFSNTAKSGYNKGTIRSDIRCLVVSALLGSRAVDVVNRYSKSRQPFMVSLHFNAPHWPWEAPGDEVESERLRQPGSGGLRDFDGGSQKTYQRMIEEMDRQIGRVLQALDANGLTER